MPTAADRRRRTFAVALALVVAALGVLSGSHRAAAQDPCPVTNPLCHSTSTSFVVTTTEPDTSTTDDTVPRDVTSTTQRHTTTTREATTTTARSVTVSTANDLLIPGDGTKGAESTTTAAPSLASGSSGLSDDQLIVLIVGGLAVVALLIGILLWRYWSATRPTVAERQ